MIEQPARILFCPCGGTMPIRTCLRALLKRWRRDIAKLKKYANQTPEDRERALAAIQALEASAGDLQMLLGEHKGRIP